LKAKNKNKNVPLGTLSVSGADNHWESLYLKRNVMRK